MALPSFAEVRSAYRPSEATLLARDGRPLHSLRVDMQVRRLAWTPLADISPALLRAVIAAEDKRFMEHGGVDWLAAGSAAWNNLRGSRTRGASTLTMQLAGLIEEDGQRRGQRSFFAKIGQSTAALRLERSWSKGRIVEAYLNLVAFRGELQGVAAMSRSLFGKWPHGLDDRESAIAAVLLRAPNVPPETVARRACSLLTELQRADECRGLEAFTFQALNNNLRDLRPEAPQLAPHLARKLLAEPGRDRRSSLDADLQAFARDALRRHLSALSRQNAEDGAVLVIDNASGEILAWVGSSGDLSGAAEVDGATALRQAGSTLKPFLYAQAFERRLLTPASLIDDAPLSLDTGNGLYTPQNYDPEYRGWVSARHALAGSLNVPAVKTLVRVGANAFQDRLKAHGFASLKEDGDWYGYSLALGSADISLLMLANAYRTLANGGRWTPLRAVPARDATVPPCRQGGCEGVFAGQPRAVDTPAAAFLVADILADRAARAGTFGLESWLTTPYWSAVKTGTSKDMRDNWCAGFSRRYTVAVWVGNASGSPMHDVSGISGAAPVWREVMDRLQRAGTASSTAPTAPPAVVGRDIRFEPAVEAARREWFLKGTEMGVIRAARADTLARITYPTDGTVIALDPDIPPDRQRIPLRLSAPAQRGWQWQIDGKVLARASNPASWLPQPGRHQLSLHDARGKMLDSVDFEIRAMRGKARQTSR
ncbi:penicillin-binding protein 1C [Azonexus hydrophilus]|uniref:penicillin-binding protein 1C n=1 Tax=Azonexus hydrophilus TaxID=418702 RepID=UPI001F0A613B|nr:penicillin-binding protein 1C [Azonexus hydrophilus]